MADLQPVTLPRWPTTTTNLAWATDGLVVATDEYFHVLTPRSAIEKLQDVNQNDFHWHVSTHVANQFKQFEWPSQTLATIKHLSIGEEQSNSHITHISWSYQGLGPHERAVLGVLTANLVLSLWSNDGSSDKWDRICIVNQHLVDEPVMDGTENNSEAESGSERRSSRIRAFAWLPPIEVRDQECSGPSSKAHCLIVANDNASIVVLKVYRTVEPYIVTWKIQKVFQTTLPVTVFSDQELKVISPLQRRLIEQSPISSITCSEWTEVNLPQDRTGEQILSSHIICQTGHLHYESCITVPAEGLESISLIQLEPEFRVTRMRAGSEISAAISAGTDNLAVEEFFEEQITSVCDRFSRYHSLRGAVRARLWGSATAPDKSHHALCISLHPSDMVEQSTPSSERCIVLFKTGVQQHPNPDEFPQSSAAVVRSVLDFLSGIIKNIPLPLSKLDRNVLQSLYGLASTLGDRAELQDTLRATVDTLLPGTNGSDSSLILAATPPTNLTSRDPSYRERTELCEICESPIPFSSDTTLARCIRGHQFTRCQLSFVPIQEPGISKYCSGCGRQFLHLPKLGLSRGPSLSQALFATFDVCPYCSAKFRG